jgi:hypothetical protein
MSLRRGETKVDYLYIGLAKREVPPGQKAVSPYIYTITKDGQTIYQSPYLTVEVGTIYHFVIDTPGHPFYITTHPRGGGVAAGPSQSMAGAIEIIPESTGQIGNVGIEKGTLSWTPAALHSQMKLFYQCNYYPDMGNSIIVSDGNR